MGNHSRKNHTGAYPSVCIMKKLGVFLLPPGWDAWMGVFVERVTIRVKRLAQENNAMSLARAGT